jgi:transcriptional regulator with XRE-family HTH domain
MITRIREVRRARGMTLDDVARACDPPTTPQTIGRLETGTRTVSVGWLNRIAKALGVDAQDLVERGDAAEIKVAALLGPGGAHAPKRAAIVVPPRVDDGLVAVIVSAGVGDYRSGDEIWCETLGPDDYARALNRDDEKLQILPLEAGGRQQVIANPPWVGVAVKLVRGL